MADRHGLTRRLLRRRFELDLRLREMAKRERRYGGVDVVPMAEVYSIIEEVIAPAQLGFVPVRPRWWAKRQDEEHISLVQLAPMKGRSVAIRWGVAVSYVPHRLTPRTVWHRTLKQARFDLWTDSGEVCGDGRTLPDGYIHTMLGCRCVQDDARQVWAGVRERALRFWAGTASPSGVLATAEAQAEQPSIHWPRPGLVAACALARLGDLPAARRRLAAGDVVLDTGELGTAQHVLTVLASRT
jgi:hypothetical protein